MNWTCRDHGFSRQIWFLNGKLDCDDFPLCLSMFHCHLSTGALKQSCKNAKWITISLREYSRSKIINLCNSALTSVSKVHVSQPLAKPQCWVSILSSDVVGSHPPFKKNTPSHCMVPNVCKSPRKNHPFLGVFDIFWYWGNGMTIYIWRLGVSNLTFALSNPLGPAPFTRGTSTSQMLVSCCIIGATPYPGDPWGMGIILHSEQTFIHHKVVSHNHPGDIMASQFISPCIPWIPSGVMVLWSVDPAVTTEA